MQASREKARVNVGKIAKYLSLENKTFEKEDEKHTACGCRSAP